VSPLSTLSTLKWTAIALAALAGFVAVFALARDQNSLPFRYFNLYVGSLDRKLRRMFMATRGLLIAWTQVLAMVATLAVALMTHQPTLYLLVVPCALGPVVFIEHLRRQRLRAIEAKIDGFVLSLANALKATPSIGNALGYTQQLLAPPLDVEVGMALKEMRLGSTVDQALLGMAGRIRSLQLDAALSGLLIGRQVGGDLPKILEKTAETLREMARLQGVVRSKTAEGKAQLMVLAIFPAVILILFDTVSRGYFDPLMDSVFGWGVIAVSIALWVGSLLMARKVLAVDI
jgi:tight adherence protein B